MKNILFSLMLIGSFINANEMIKVDIEHDKKSRHYLKYLPLNYDSSEPINLVIALHGYGGTASGFEYEITGNMNELADKYNFIAIYPQATYFHDYKTYGEKTFISAFNDFTGSKTTALSGGEICDKDAFIYPKFPNCENQGRCAWQPCTNDVDYLRSIIFEIKDTYTIKNVYMMGNSNGGMTVTAFACQYPQYIHAFISVNGMQANNSGCSPIAPVNSIFYASFNDTGVPPVNIRSSDGYFYEPLESVISRWTKSFNCASSQSKEYSINENYVEELYLNCDQNKSVISILNMNAEHMWPETGFNENTRSSNYIAFGYCAMEIQSDLDYIQCDTDNNNNGTEFLLSKLLEFN